MPRPTVIPETLQEIFSTAVRGLCEQGWQQATNTERFTCLYRAPGGLACAIGQCMPDNLPSYVLEHGGSISGLLRDYPEYFPPSWHRMEDELSELQRCHDCADDPQAMINRLIRFATDRDLVWPGDVSAEFTT